VIVVSFLFSTMRYKLTFAGIGILTLTIAACSVSSIRSPAGGDGTAFSSSSEASSLPEQEIEVSYQGTLEEAGVGIYMEGTHRLRYGEGQFLLLESDTVSLNEFVDDQVRVTGVVRPTVEGVASIMRVTQIASILSGEESSSSSSMEESSSSSTEETSSPSFFPVLSSLPALQLPSSSSDAPPPPRVSSAAASSAAASSAVATAGASSEQTSAMAKANMSVSNWNQQYCTSHIGFCVPVHKNWWYNSFGAENGTLWYVEMSASEIQNVGDGPLSVSFLSGSLPSGTTDGSVVEQGVNVVGFRAWTGQRHFEIRAPRELRDAVTYMTQNLSTSEVPAAASSSL
jgi:hypothetical protein